MTDDPAAIESFRARVAEAAARLMELASPQNASLLGVHSAEVLECFTRIGAEARKARFEGLRRIADAGADAAEGWTRGGRVPKGAAGALGRIAARLEELVSVAPDEWSAWTQRHRSEMVTQMSTLALEAIDAVAARSEPTATERQVVEPLVAPDLVALFVAEVDNGAPRLQELVLALEAQGGSPSDAGEAMRLVHSLKGAARIVGLDGVVSLLHASEDVLSAASAGRAPSGDESQALLELVDVLHELVAVPVLEVAAWIGRQGPRLAGLGATLRRGLGAPSTAASIEVAPAPRGGPEVPQASDPRALRVSADSLGRLLGLAGETVVEVRRLAAGPRSSRAERLSARVATRAIDIQRLAAAAGDDRLNAMLEGLVEDAREAARLFGESREQSAQGVQRLLDVGERLYLESLRTRQRPFAQLVPGMRRQVRDAGRALGKRVRLEVGGSATLVDGDVLAAVEPMLHHLLTNAVDHGLEAPADRAAAGKPEVGTIRVDLEHARGHLSLTVSDDGAGIDVERVRATVLRRELVDELTARTLGRAELLEMLFVPGFSTRVEVDHHSGRGVGLDAVRSDVVRLGGRIALVSELGVYTRFELTLPVTRAVVRALLIRVAGETYALPLVHVGRVVRVPVERLHTSEGREYVELDGMNVGVVHADEVLEIGPATPRGADLTIVVLGDQSTRYGLVVDATLGEDDLVVRPLDLRLGPVTDVASTALLADGSPTLVLDAMDLLHSIEMLSQRQRPTVRRRPALHATTSAKRVLVVDDSLTVREVERQLLTGRGYDVELAVDGMQAWNLLRQSDFDLLVADVDMPRLDGIELVRMVRADARLARLPVIIVSYKERDSDRLRGLEVGADLYLKKSSFHDEQLVNAVRDLIGEAR